MRLKLSNNSLIDDIDRWVKSFNEYIETYNQNEHTKDTIDRALFHFREYALGCDEEYLIDEINQMFFVRFLNYLKKDAKLKSSTINLTLIHVKSLFKHISVNNREKFSYTDILALVKPLDEKDNNELNIKSFSKEDFDKINEYIYEKTKGTQLKEPSFIAIRNFVLLRILLYTGVRASELCNIRINDIKKIENNTFYRIKVTRKGGYIDYVRIRIDLLPDRIFINYLNTVKNMTKEENPYIALTAKGKQLSRQNLWKITVTISNKLGIEVGNPHSFRHTLGTLLITHYNVNPIIGQQMLGHKNLTTFTKYYVHVDEKDITSIAKIL